MKKDKVVLENCEICLQRIELPELGEVCFRWKKGRKWIESSSYLAHGGIIKAKEKLQMNLKFYTKAGIVEEKKVRPS